jgi:exodeoxyribonuclease V beta subunit
VTSHREARPFDLHDPLPAGVTVLEASAGTGKTYAIAGLAARYVAEGVPLERLLMVTFTRMATGELRERVRERLVSVERDLELSLASVSPQVSDPVVELLAQGSDEDTHLHRNRLARALADFDAATIATTHGFCEQVLGGLGIAADLEPGVSFVEDLSELVADVVDDVYVRRSTSKAGPPPFRRAEAAEIARVAVGNAAARIAPAGGEVPEMRRRLALAVREELERRKRRAAVMSYDDLLTRLDAALTGPQGPATAERLRSRYDVVLVDEFQDTDPIQWDIMRRAFAETGATLVLIADPKQAIYAFRGADVYAYLAAAREATTRATLPVNWRSDQGLIDAYDALFAGAKLGEEGIVYRHVRAADAHQAPRLHTPPVPEPLRIRFVDRNAVALTKRGYASAPSAREHIAKDLSADIVALLSSDAETETRADDGTTIARSRIRPAHIAVLVRRNRDAALIREALDAAGVPAVINGAGSVFGTDQAREWLRLLEALERPASTTRAHSVALTCFLGWSADELADADEEAWANVHLRLHDWARVLRSSGVASLLERITLVEGLPERILRQIDGERQLTDLRHVGQLLHSAASAEQLGTTALTAWLRRRIAEAAADTNDEERSRRLESDAEAVQVLTIHRSKGLEFPVVYLPFLWEPGWIPQEPQPVVFHDPDASDARTIDVALAGPDFARHRERYIVEQRGEDLRLAYVALTRARHQAIVWWAGSWDSHNSPLGRLLFARDPDGTVSHEGRGTPEDAIARKRFEALAAEAPGCVGLEQSTLGTPTSWAQPVPEHEELSAAIFDRRLDRGWRRTSYSDITAGTYEPRVGSEPAEETIQDEPPPEAVGASTTDAAPGDPAMATESLWTEVPVGLRLGTLVHRVMERTDFAATDLVGELATQLAAANARHLIAFEDPTALIEGLRAAIETPLGPTVGGVSLRDIASADRLNELEFELPLVGGDEPSGWVTLAAVRDVLREHLPADDPLAGYADRLDDRALRQSVRGYLTGSLDLVIRLASNHHPRFAVVDYKTNWLAGADEKLTLWHHRPEALAAEMHGGHYGLQALLYVVALHRYLRWRLDDYEPDRDLAGVHYLFLRGMSGPDTPTVDGTPCGVFAWRPPPPLLDALSDILDRGVAT